MALGEKHCSRFPQATLRKKPQNSIELQLYTTDVANFSIHKCKVKAKAGELTFILPEFKEESQDYNPDILTPKSVLLLEFEMPLIQLALTLAHRNV